MWQHCSVHWSCYELQNEIIPVPFIWASIWHSGHISIFKSYSISSSSTILITQMLFSSYNNLLFRSKTVFNQSFHLIIRATKMAGDWSTCPVRSSRRRGPCSARRKDGFKGDPIAPPWYLRDGYQEDGTKPFMEVHHDKMATMVIN